ncbi:MAG TPA: hypothetical protein DIU15_00295, partial [Deltaproteobacteria bacterium]|nr:hypothetical protein [Deltaproteobacteria bacterium]
DDDDDDDDDDDTSLDSDNDGVIDSEDCEPLNSSIYPGANEFCDGVDSDCGGEAESQPTGSPQEMFAFTGGDLLLTVASHDADCFMTVSVTSPLVASNVVSDASAQVGQTINVGPIPGCSSIELLVNSCSPSSGPANPANDYSTTNGNAFQIAATGTGEWTINHDDQQFDLFGADFNDLVLQLSVD